MEKPIVNKPFTFEMPVSLDALTECGDADGLNDLMDEHFWDTYGEELMPTGVSYKPIRVEDGKIIIQVDCENMEADENVDE